jgi:uncharacterized protein (TIGR01777 family)
LAQHLVARNAEVVAFSRKSDVNLPWATEVRHVANDGPAINPRGLDVIVNLAGEPIIGLWTKAKKKRLTESRIDLTERVVESLRNCPASERPKALINGSAVGFYGDRADEMLPESSGSGATFLAKLCLGWESAAFRAETLGMRVVVLRTGLVFGNGSGIWPLLRRVFSLGLGGKLGSGRQWVPWIHLEDEIGIIAQAVENDTYAGPVNLASPGIVSNAELTKTVASVLKRPAFLPAPAFALKLVLGDLGRSVLESERAIPKTALAHGYEFRHPELRGALQNLIGS